MTVMIVRFKSWLASSGMTSPPSPSSWVTCAPVPLLPLKGVAVLTNRSTPPIWWEHSRPRLHSLHKSSRMFWKSVLRWVHWYFFFRFCAFLLFLHFLAIYLSVVSNSSIPPETCPNGMAMTEEPPPFLIHTHSFVLQALPFINNSFMHLLHILPFYNWPSFPLSTHNFTHFLLKLFTPLHNVPCHTFHTL